MAKNINFDANDEDTEGHMIYNGEQPGIVDNGEQPGAAEDDDTEGHMMYNGEQPGITGALSVDPKTLG